MTSLFIYFKSVFLGYGNIFYKKTSAPVQKHNILESYKGYSEIMCAFSCKRLSCSYFTTANDETRHCTVYGDVKTIESDHGDVTVWKNTGKSEESF